MSEIISVKTEPELFENQIEKIKVRWKEFGVISCIIIWKIKIK